MSEHRLPRKPVGRKLAPTRTQIAREMWLRFLGALREECGRIWAQRVTPNDYFDWMQHIWRRL